MAQVQAPAKYTFSNPSTCSVRCVSVRIFRSVDVCVNKGQGVEVTHSITANGSVISESPFTFALAHKKDGQLCVKEVISWSHNFSVQPGATLEIEVGTNVTGTGMRCRLGVLRLNVS